MMVVVRCHRLQRIWEVAEEVRAGDRSEATVPVHGMCGATAKARRAKVLEKHLPGDGPKSR